MPNVSVSNRNQPVSPSPFQAMIARLNSERDEINDWFEETVMTLTRLENGRQEILGLLPWDPEKAPIDQSHRIAGAKARAAGAKGRPGGISSSGIVRLNRKLKRMATEKPKASKIAGRMKQVFDALPPLAKVGGPVGSSAAGLVLLSKRTKMTRSYVSNCLTSLIKFGMVKRVDRGLYARTRG